MATLIDGLGGEEVAGSGLQAGAANISPYFTGSITTESNINATTGSVTGGVLGDAIGAVKTVIISQATNIPGMSVIVGSVLTGNGGVGVVNFQAADFANANYMFVATARQYNIPGASGLNIGASGTRRASGLEILGPSGTVFDWIAIGQR